LESHPRALDIEHSRKERKKEEEKAKNKTNIVDSALDGP